MTLTTLGRFLIGSRQAILELAASKTAVVVGLLFVLAAGLAREYDQEDLRSEPWHLLLPLGASLGTSAFLYLLLQTLFWFRGGEEDGRRLGFQQLLTLYWMTAPLALLYGIPVERFLSAADATRANLALLGLVSLWRVVLITRALSVIYEVGFFRALFPVMLFADSVALVLLGTTPRPILGIMGGIRLSESEFVLLEVTFVVQVLGFLSWPIWCLGSFFAVNSQWQLTDLPASPSRVRLDVWIAAAAAILLWLPFLPATQNEQRLRHDVETALRADEIPRGLDMMSSHERSDFPPHWDPPPRLAYREAHPNVVDLMAHLDVVPITPWVKEVYREKFTNSLRGSGDGMGVWWELKPEDIERRIAILETLPDRPAIIREQEHGLRDAMERVSSPLKERIAVLLDEAKKSAPDEHR